MNNNNELSFTTIVFILFLITIFISIIILFTLNAHAMPSPVSYNPNECEKAAKDFQNEFGGSLIWIQPLKENGAFDLDKFNGHMINKVWIKGNNKYFYIDYPRQDIYDNVSDIHNHLTQKSIIYDLEFERPPFPMIWNY